MDENEAYSWTGWLKGEIDRNRQRVPQKGCARPQRISGRYVYKHLVELGAVDPEPEVKRGKRSSERVKPVPAVRAPQAQPAVKRMTAGGAA